MNVSRLKRVIVFCVFGAISVFPFSLAHAQSLSLAPGSPDSYAVKEGDTLWDIASIFLEEPWRWPEIWEGNPDVEDPDLIYPGDILRLVESADGPRIVMERGDRQTIKLSPTVRETPLLNPIPTIPRQALQGLLVENRIVDKASFEASPYILSSASDNLIMGAGHEVIVRGEWASDATAYEIFRLGATYIGDEGVLLGQEAIKLGALNVVSDEGEGLKRALIVQSSEELKAGDHLLPQEAARINLDYFPTTPDASLQGSIIGLLNNESQAAQFESTVLNLGQNDGLAEGDVLSIFREGDEVRDPVTRKDVRLPSTEIGMLLVYRVFERMSYGVILSLTQPSSVGDTIRTP
jgi:hypothetical protein